MRRRLLLALAVLVTLAGCCELTTGAALADSHQTSIFQDDLSLVGSSGTTMFNTLATLEALGVQEVRVNVDWNQIAPDPTSTTMPAGFDPADEAAYPSANWAPYDRLANSAALYGITVQFNLTGPGPLWAMGQNSPTARAATHWEPNAVDYFDFVYAMGERYSGNDGVTAVTNWSIWNEPDQPGWLAPQWLKIGRKVVPESPKYYRGLVNSGFYGLLDSGHPTSTNTILIGETAPEGEDTGGFYTAMTPIPFLRTLYCVNARDRPLRGATASEVGCPTRGPVADFVHANGGLFDASGFSHHPYDFFEKPTYSQPDLNEAPLADIGRLETFLDRAFGVYGVHEKIPLYFTEYGYETNPPDPHQVVTPAEQAAYLNESDYMAWRNPRVKSVAQFLLYDSAPNAEYTPGEYDYWDTFQTGLLYLNGTPKPAYAAYRMPIWLPTTHVRPHASVFVWGQVRPADRIVSQPVQIQWRSPGGAWGTLARAHTGTATGYFSIHVTLPGSGYVRSLWTVALPSGGSVSYASRRVAVRVKR
jgi:hypothetical protein